MTKILVHLATGPENPTRGALAFRVAATAAQQGHEATMFLAGDGVAYLRTATREAAHGIGTGSVREFYDALVAAGGQIYASKMSSGAREIDAAVAGSRVQLVPPDRLVELIVESDRVVSY